MQYSKRNFDHAQPMRTGVMLINLGTPDAPTASAVRRYLAQFLSDPRVVEIPRLIWKLILHCVILRFRPRRVAKNYAKIWTEDGSPLKVHTANLTVELADRLGERQIPVVYGMCYGNPSLQRAWDALKEEQVTRLLLIPLYPQYSATTTAAAFDGIASVMRQERWMPELRWVNHYHDHPQYIAALAASIRKHWNQHGKADRLMMSFHGIPERYVRNGDPYRCHCYATARLVAERLELADDEYHVTFQSRLGREPWLQPYTDHTLERWGGEGVETVQVICPGFAADCLETLEEIQMENAQLFQEAGGKSLEYIPALNDSDAHVELMAELVMTHGSGWPEVDSPSTDSDEVSKHGCSHAELVARKERAEQLERQSSQDASSSAA